MTTYNSFSHHYQHEVKQFHVIYITISKSLLPRH